MGLVNPGRRARRAAAQALACLAAICVTAGLAAFPATAGTGSPFHPARDHAANEELLADSGVAWTSLRNGFTPTAWAGCWAAGSRPARLRPRPMGRSPGPTAPTPPKRQR
jgi:uncharacterized protein YbjT (DUF2867 family)